MGRRAKLVRETFQGLNREQFGKERRTLVVEEPREFGLHLNEELYPRVVEDIWAEHWPS